MSDAEIIREALNELYKYSDSSKSEEVFAALKRLEEKCLTTKQ